MEYEEKYNAALERAKKLQKTCDSQAVVGWCEYIFPELKESEDEKNRKEIIDFLQETIDNIGESPNIWTMNNAKKWIAWLEKQKNTSDKEYVFRPLAGDTIEKAAERAVELDGKVVLAFNGAYIPIGNKTKDEIVAEYNSWLEKQGKQKHFSDFKAEDWYVSKVDGKIHNMTYNPADKIEPKFKVGDFIANDYCSGKVIEITNDAYLLDTGQGIPFSCEHNAHLWTIEDAKDGDVLVASDGSIFLFAGVDDCACKYYIALTTDNCLKINKEVKGGYWETSRAVYPATKEQRDLLFQKMADEGYEWNAEKKELKTIEQKHVDNVEPKFKVGDWIVLPLGIIAHIESLNSTDYQVTTTDGKICDFKISKQDNYRLWTIADAKDGDVLIDVYGNIGIFDKCYDFDWMSSCSLGKYGGFQYFTVEHENEKTYPATKEQCDLLFQKMKEEGWEWDREKKELKKIPNASEECEIEHIEHGKYYYCIKDYYSGGNKRASKGEVIQALRGMTMMALGVKANEYFIPVKCIVGDRCDWSEEDDKIRKELITHCRNTRCTTEEGTEKIAKWIAWLEKQGHMLDPDKVIEWLNDQACQGWIEDVEVDKFIDKFKKDFGL